MTIEFKEWPKISRLFRDVIITEKIDGTNSAIGIVHEDELDRVLNEDGTIRTFFDNDIRHITAHVAEHVLYVQSRSRIITPEFDNFGFAAWCAVHAEELIKTLGVGLHFGEFWGSGIQRGYGLPKGERRFSLFNTPRYGDPEKFDLSRVKGLSTVPVLYTGPFSTEDVEFEVEKLRANGSVASPGFMDPEGIVTFHTASNTAFKTTIKNDEKPKGKA